MESQWRTLRRSLLASGQPRNRTTSPWTAPLLAGFEALLYTSQRWGIATPEVRADRNGLAASETTRRCAPSNRYRTPSGSSLRNLGGAARDRGYGGVGDFVSPCLPNRHPLPSRHGTVETPQTVYDTLLRPWGRRGVSPKRRCRSGPPQPPASRSPSAEMCIRGWSQGRGESGRWVEARPALVRSAKVPLQNPAATTPAS